jgi:glycosyltransferase involved in cell wall biosynthesis
LVLFEGLPPTVIDSQVLTHARLMRQELGIDLTVIAFACTDSIFRSAGQRLDRARQIAGGPVLLHRGLRPAWPGSLHVNRRRLRAALQMCGDIAFIHARADYAAAVAGPLAQQMNAPMLWDCRGDTVAEFDQRVGARGPGLRAIAGLRAALLERDRRLAGSSCAGAIFVSEQLRALLAPEIGDKPSWVMPCFAHEDEFFFDAALRSRTRAALGLADDEAVFLYSGSLVAYQRFDESVELVRTILRAGRKARLLVVTPDCEAARPLLARLPAATAICVSAALSEVNGYLNAADFGLLLRDPDGVNRVAFPTKFAEYSLAGLSVVMKDDPPSCVAMARDLGTYVPVADAAGAVAAGLDERMRRAAAAVRRLGRRAALPTFNQIYASMTQATRGLAA